MHSFLQKKTISSYVLANYRVLFGLLMLYSAIRFLCMGWVDKLYIKPIFFFSYYGFEWVKPLGNFTYFLYILLIIFSLGIVLGYRYKISTIGYFLVFTYIELMDKTTYLNHYYFISCLSFLMIFLPMHLKLSLDARQGRVISSDSTPYQYVLAIQILVGLVYFYAGLAKINADWLLNAMPLKIWLTNNYDVPLIGGLLQKNWVHYLFSWVGMLYDVFIVFLLLNKRTRLFAFCMLVVFHLLTRILFPIGVFPWVMIASATIFFSESWHNKVGYYLNEFIFKIQNSNFIYPRDRIRDVVILAFLIIQILIPWRYLLYAGNLFWNEQGYRFSWRVMLMEKRGDAQFKVVNKTTGSSFMVNNRDFLTSFQEKQMATQPDMILEYAHFLGNHFKGQGHYNVSVFVDSFVALNGSSMKRFVDRNIDLLAVKSGLRNQKWILPYEN